MSSATYDVLGIGNAIVDVIGQCDDAFLEAHGAPKGHMQLVDAEGVAKLYDAMGPSTEVSGGSAANTIAGIASLGGQTAYIGKVADDTFGRIFAHDIQAAGVTFNTQPKSDGEPTARSLVLVTPDGERTMNTFLGVSPELTEDDLDPSLIEGAEILYLEGYLFDRDDAKAAFAKASEIARKADRKVALTLSDGFCVERHRDDFKALIDGSIDILFANEAELLSLTEATNFEAAVEAISGSVPLLAATRSADGSVISKQGQTPISIAARPVDRVVDTTGAGDLYASGVLYGLSNDLALETCGALGSLAAAEVITHLGARPQTNLRELAVSAGLLQ